MITVTKQSNCASLTVTSTNFNVSNISVTLNVNKDCKTEYEFDIDTADTSIMINQAFLSLDGTALKDGIYYILLTIIDEDSNKIEESKCVFVNCNTTCDLKSSFTSTLDKDVKKTLAFLALKEAESCTDCACSDLCLLYSTITDTQCNVGCGCS